MEPKLCYLQSCSAYSLVCIVNFHNLFQNSILIPAQPMALLGFFAYHKMPWRDLNSCQLSSTRLGPLKGALSTELQRCSWFP